MDERCFECNRTLVEVAVSGELCSGCFFSFDPDKLTAALNATLSPWLPEPSESPATAVYTLSEVAAAFGRLLAHVEQQTDEDYADAAAAIGEDIIDILAGNWHADEEPAEAVTLFTDIEVSL